MHIPAASTIDVSNELLVFSKKKKKILVMLADHEDNKYDNGHGFLHFGTAVVDAS
jgi:hypothetical protein